MTGSKLDSEVIYPTGEELLEIYPELGITQNDILPPNGTGSSGAKIPRFLRSLFGRVKNIVPPHNAGQISDLIVEEIQSKRRERTVRKAKAFALALYYNNEKKWRNGLSTRDNHGNEEIENRQALLNLRPAPFPELLQGTDIEKHLWLSVFYESWQLSIRGNEFSQTSRLIELLQNLGFSVPEEYLALDQWKTVWIKGVYDLSARELGLDHFFCNDGPKAGEANDSHGNTTIPVPALETVTMLDSGNSKESKEP